MNGTPEMNRLTTIKRHNIFVVGAAVLIAASFWIIPLLHKQQSSFSYKLFKTTYGWGYDILVNDTLQIHQEWMPVIDERKSFPQQEQAQKAAMLVLEKLTAGENPAISRAELNQIINE